MRVEPSSDEFRDVELCGTFFSISRTPRNFFFDSGAISTRLELCGTFFSIPRTLRNSFFDFGAIAARLRRDSGVAALSCIALK